MKSPPIARGQEALLQQGLSAYAVIVGGRLYDAYYPTLKQAREIADRRVALGFREVEVWKFMSAHDK